MKKINVMLYGGFDKKTKNRAEIVYCDKCDNCSFYKKGTCLNVTCFLSERCKFGKISYVSGYTQRAKKRYTFDAQYKNDELYGALKHPTDWRVGRIEDIILFNLTYAICDKQRWSFNEWVDTDTFETRECGFATGTYSYVPLKELTSDILNDILSYRARSMMGGTIRDYQAKIVPNVLFELSKMLPDVYDKLINDYPEYKEITPYFIGKKALIKSLPDGFILKDSDGAFVKNGCYLECECYKRAFMPFRAKEAKMVIKITDKMTYEIRDNSEVDENTVFA